MAIQSKYPGFCPRCGKRFQVGISYIERDKTDGKWKHYPACPNVAETGDRIVYSTKSMDNDDADALSSIIGTEYVGESNTEFTPTEHQLAIFEFIKNGSGHAVIEAVAGSGKTTTIVKALDLTPKDAAVAFVAFNAHIAKELSKRAPNHVHVSTLHSLGLLNVRNNNGGKQPKIETDKLGTLMENIWPVSKVALEAGTITKQQRSEHFAKRLSMRSLVSISKSTLVDAMDGNAVLSMIERYNVEIDDEHLDELITQLPIMLDLCKQQIDVIDFDDMLWLPVVLNMSLMQFDFLMVDEAQDMNACQIQFILRSIKETGRIIAVGDRKQSLYAFRGADSQAIQNIIDALNATVLPLSITFRCPTSHVKIAQRIVPQIEARENAPDGSIVMMDYFNLTQMLEIGDMVICRTNAPLVAPAFECIRQGKKAVIRGKDIGASMVELIKRFGTDDIATFDINLGEYFEKEYQRLLDRAKEMQALLLQDKVETIRTIMVEVSTVAELINKIKVLFDDGTTGIIFSSVHRAKGLEADRVFILRPDLMPHPRAKKDYEMEQEMNCLYVAITRSKNMLHFVKGDARGVVKGELNPILTGGE